MGDAFKCKNCGTVVETPQSCPSCGETAMRPIQLSEAEKAGNVEETASETDASPNATDDGDSATADEPDEPDTASAPTRTREQDSGSGLLSWLKSLL